MSDKTKQEWHAITVTLPQEGSEWLSHLLFELGSVGNIEEEAPDPALAAMKGYFPLELGTSSAIIQQITELLSTQGIKPLSTYSTTIKIQNWAEAVRQMFSPIKILGDTTVVSPWSDYRAGPGEEVIVINPGMAFGTGMHATTQLAARMMHKAIGSEGVKKMCDVGCGSGILSIIAAKKGVRRIDAVEIDHDARNSAWSNVERNGCQENIRLLERIDLATRKYDLVVANILFSIILELKGELIRMVKKGGRLIISGITAEEDEKLLAAYDDPHLSLLEKCEQDGWMGYVFKIKN